MVNRAETDEMASARKVEVAPVRDADTLHEATGAAFSEAVEPLNVHPTETPLVGAAAIPTTEFTASASATRADDCGAPL